MSLAHCKMRARLHVIRYRVPRKSSLTQTQLDLIRIGHERSDPVRQIALNAGTSVSTVQRAIGQIVPRVRTADEFKGYVPSVARQRQQPNNCGWTVEQMRAARDDQMAGQFMRPVQLAKAMRTDPALFNAWTTRLAPQSAVQTRFVAAPGTRGEAVARKAALSCHVSRGTIASIHSSLVDHGVAVGHIIRDTLEDGSRVNMRLEEWPLEFVRWDAYKELLVTSTLGGITVPITHGDGEWVVFRKFDVLPWTKDACLLAGALIWGAHAFASTDWAAASKSHGQAKIVGSLPAGVSIQSAAADGTVALSPEAYAYLNMLQDLVEGQIGAGLAPAGATTQWLANSSTAWQVFAELMSNVEKAAMRIYTGTDASLGSAGGAPGVDIATLFGVSTTKIQGDFDAIEQGLWTGLYQPWTAINCGDSHLAPRLEYQLPDPDADSKSAQRAAARTRLTSAIKDMRDQQLTVDQETVNALAAEFGVERAPALAELSSLAPTIILDAATTARAMRVREVRAAGGMPALGDPRDDLFMQEFEDASKAAAKGRADAATAEAKAVADAQAAVP